MIGRANIHFHTLRHSFATHALIDHKRSLKAVSRYLGHSTKAITADFYIHGDLTIDDIRRIGG
ncbi:MAG: tyrosine-type recombinase/integrase [Candidatus Zixiibacteriota bacterium]